MRRISTTALMVIAALCGGCGGESTDQKLAKIAVWEDQGWTADGQLVAMLKDGDEEVRRRAAIALARVNDTLTYDAVRDALINDRDPGVRAAAAFVFGVGRWQKGHGDLFAALKREDDPRSKRDLLEAIGRVYARDSYQQVFPFLHDPDPSVRAQTLITLDLLNRRDEVDSLLPLLHDSDREVLWAALQVLLQTRSPQTAVAAMPFTRDTSAIIRRQAFRVVGSSPDPAMKDSLLVGLQDPDPMVRAAAAEAFGMQVDTLAILKVYPRIDAEDSPLVLMNMCRALAEHWRIQSEPYLRGLIQHPDPGVRAAAAKAAVRRLDFDFADVIAPAASDRDPSVRYAYLEAVDDLTRYGLSDPGKFIETVDRLTRDSVPRVRALAVQSYISYRGEHSEEYLNRLFNDPDPYCLHTAINLIGMYRLQMYQDSIYARYPDYADMWRPEIKWGMLAATINMAPSVTPDEQQRTICNWGINDPNRLVRWYAIAVWDKFREDHRSALGVYKTDLTPENVGELLHPYPSNPSARLQTTRGPITIELWQDKAPRTARRFIQLAQGGYYDNCPMNDVQPGDIVQTGDRRGDGWGLPDESVRDEIQPDRVDAGTLLWLINTRDAGHGAFAIALSRAPYLDWRYGTFARVTEGLDVARQLTFADTLKSVEIIVPQM